MSVYLQDIPLNEAIKRLNQALNDIGYGGTLEAETIKLDENANGRTLGDSIWAKISSPHYHASAMDGFAVKSTDTHGALTTSPLVLSCEQPQMQAKYIDTGDPLPDWANAVIPIENVEPLNIHQEPAKNPRNPTVIRIRASISPWSHVRPMGEDIIKTQLVLPAGHILRPVDLGAIAACGYDTVNVIRKPKVAILPTGSELVELGKQVLPGDIIEFNSIILAAQINQWGGIAKRFSPTPDIKEKLLEKTLEAAQDHDLILINAGSSAGSEDYTADIIAQLGRVLVHGVAIRPGHPVILGLINLEHRTILVIGVPGYPVSATLTGEIFIEPIITRWLGKKPKEPQTLEAFLTRKVTSPAGDDDYMRVAVAKVDNKYLAAPLSRGAGVISSLVQADGLALIPRGTQGLPAGASAHIQLYRSQSEIDKTILIIGSHDISLEILAQYLTNRDRRISSANVGSQGGLVALKRNQAHLAGSHLLDPKTGDYNLSYVHQYLPNTPITVVAFVRRQQGLIVQKGNPKSIQTIRDLTNPNISITNRQRGAGTRVLLDFLLEKENISPGSIQGYSQEEYTHLMVAAAVASGRSDCGLGIAAAAHALDLDFIPLETEHFDLIIPTRHYNTDLLAPLIKLLHEKTFQSEIQLLPGYESSDMGKISAEFKETGT